MKTINYRGWKIYGSVATKSGTTIYGDSITDVKRRIRQFMAQFG